MRSFAYSTAAQHGPRKQGIVDSGKLEALGHGGQGTGPRPASAGDAPSRTEAHRMTGPPAAMELKVRVSAPKASQERVDELARDLMDEVRQLDVRNVKPAPGAPLPSGAKGTAMELGAFIVSLGTPVLGPLIGVLQAFVTRPSTSGTTLELEVNGRKMTLRLDPKMSPEEQRAVIREARETLEAAAKA
jgi:hypothetical protein